MNKLRIQAFVRMVSILMFFLSFFVHYVLCTMDLLESFLIGMIALIISTFVLYAILMIWRLVFTADEWKIIVDGKPKAARKA